MNEKTAQKWLKAKKKKQEVSESTAAINFKTHKVSQTESEIIIPPNKYPQFQKEHQILVIECGKQKVLVQVMTPNTYAAHHHQIEQKSQISVLRSILDLHGVQCSPTGMFKGEIRILNQSKLNEYTLEIVEFLIKETYFSRRDQFKVMKALKESLTHVYLKKTLHFDQISFEVNAMMRNNQTLVKTGIIDKNTKLIFRTNCSKLTVGIELSTETFELNENKQVYLQKMFQFLYVYLHRNIFFNNSHRLTLIFFGRCFYPQFDTLQDAYDYLLKENSTINNHEKFQINFSVALQKDYRGRIFQDVYRRIIWSSDMIEDFRQYFWEKISEFIFSLNWDFSDNLNHIGQFITKSLLDKIEQRTIDDKLRIDDKNNFRVKPFIHKLRCKLACSKDTNIFEAISLISEQYRHHYKFRSLTEAGNTIIILSAGNSSYEVDELSYKMAKSYIYLTNISCSLINFAKKKETPMRAQIVCLQKKPLFNVNNRGKLQNMSLNCVQKQVYLSPMNEDMIIWDNFQYKNMIFPEQLIEADRERHKHLREQHHCSKQSHYQLCQSVKLTKKDFTVKQKDVSFINVSSMSDSCLYIHEVLYDNLHIIRLNPNIRNTTRLKNSEIDIFAADLDKIIIGKKQWTLEAGQNEVENKLQSYRGFIEKNISRNIKEERQSVIEKTAKAIFKESNDIEEEFNSGEAYETMSNDEFKFNYSDKMTVFDQRVRKNSDFVQSDILDTLDRESPKGKVNIFQETYRNKNHEYNAGQKSGGKAKKDISHNKQRCKNNFLESNIHYLVPYFSEPILKRFKAFIRKEYIEELKNQQQRIVMLFNMQKLWKSICFPLLTPIYTKYKENFKETEQNLDAGVIDESNDKRISILEDQICKLLMKNYQIDECSSQYGIYSNITKLSKGHVSCHLQKNGNNLSRFYVIDKRKQEKIVPFMLYRYLCYEDKDCRFCAKYVYFQDKNYYEHSKKQQNEIKTIKIVLACEDSVTNNDNLMNSFSGGDGKRRGSESNTKGSFAVSSPNKRDLMQDFVKMFNDRYKELSIDLSWIEPKRQPNKKKVTINFSKKQSRALYHHQEIQLDISTEYNTRCLFEVLVSWNLCSSVIVNEFVENVMTMGRRSKLRPYLVTAGNIFNTIWSITTIGEIIFQHRISLDLLQASLLKAGEWLWDSNDYYLHITGISFIQFKKDKKLILWRDNYSEKRARDIKKDDSYKQYNKFFMRAAVFDFMGDIIVKVIDQASAGKKRLAV